MQRTGWVVFAVFLAACTPRAFPLVGDYQTAMTSAERLLNDASAIGADSLVPSAMQEARERIAEAQLEQRTRDTKKAALKARQAVASATYAKAAAERVIADRERAATQAGLSEMPNPGGTR